MLPPEAATRLRIRCFPLSPDDLYTNPIIDSTGVPALATRNRTTLKVRFSPHRYVSLGPGGLAVPRNRIARSLRPALDP